MIKTRLKEILEEQNLTINKVSNEAEISRPSLTALVNNDSGGIQFETLEKLTTYLDVSIEDILIQTKDEIKFIYKSTVPLNSIKKAEEAEFKKETKENFVQVNPSDALPFKAFIIENETNGEPFYFTISPLEKDKEIFGLLINFYRTDEKGNKQPTEDLERFFAKLSTKGVINFCNSVIGTWLQFYGEIDDVYNQISELIIIDMTIVEGTGKIPLVAYIKKKKRGKGIFLDFNFFEEISPIKGDQKYSDLIEFINMDTDSKYSNTI